MRRESERAVSPDFRKRLLAEILDEAERARLARGERTTRQTTT
jgi:hypothetical protein